MHCKHQSSWIQLIITYYQKPLDSRATCSFDRPYTRLNTHSIIYPWHDHNIHIDKKHCIGHINWISREKVGTVQVNKIFVSAQLCRYIVQHKVLTISILPTIILSIVPSFVICNCKALSWFLEELTNFVVAIYVACIYAEKTRN